MKTKTLLFLALATLGLAFVTLHAQPASETAIVATGTAANESFQLPPEASNFVLALLGKLMVKYPWLATLVAFVGSARLWAKPLSSVVHNFIELSPSKRDDDWLRSFVAFFNENPVGRVLAYLLDWFTSIKIQVPNNPELK